MIPTNITEEHIKKAIEEIGKSEMPKSRASYSYYLDYEGKQYAPKYVISIANKYANGKELHPNDFHANQAKKYLEQLNFIVVDESRKYVMEKLKQIQLNGHRVFKISMGSFLKDPNFKHIDPINVFEHNNLIVMHSATKKNQGNLFKNDLKIGDYVYLTYGQKRLGGFYRIKSDAVDVKTKVNVDLGSGWICREVEMVQPALIDNTHDLKNKSEWLPSGNSTFKEVKDLSTANKILFNKYYGIDLQDENNKNSASASQIKTNNFMENPLNQILYGPPGTGKTYKTVAKAVSLVRNVSLSTIENQERKVIKEDYDLLVKKNQILFTTFHQSMSYEDFVEGIKPRLIDDNDSNDIDYEISPGIFKIACARAAYNAYLEHQNAIKSKTSYTYSQLYEAFIEMARNKINEDDFFICKTMNGKDVEIYLINKMDSIKARAKGSSATHVAPLTKENLQKLYDKFESPDEIISLQEIRDTTEVSPRSSEFYAVFKALKEFEANNFEPEVILDEDINVEIEASELVKQFDSGVYTKAVIEKGSTAAPIVLIVDEINRGNVSAIFGELITLIEEDKRTGMDNEIRLTLPYSKKKFSVPPNLFIVGTMNTADRSVEALDTALRRRFVFEEMMPIPELITEKGKAEKGMIGELNLVNLLKTINERISVLIDRDHTIGHSYLLNVSSLKDLKRSFHNNIIPLLQEYFYGDYRKLEMVIGDKFFVKEKKSKILFATKHDDFDTEGEIYDLKDVSKFSDNEMIEAITSMKLIGSTEKITESQLN